MADFLRTDAADKNFRELVKLLDADLRIKDGEDHTFYAQFNKIDAIRNVLVAYVNEQAVGCGAFKPFNADTVEIKRMFVLPEFRGRGIAKKILSGLEEWAAETGYKSCVLETGKKQGDAIQLYLKTGYQRIPNYGQYAHVENSICMEKQLNVKFGP